MKILQINKFLYPKGGSETYMFELSNALNEYGYEIEFWGMADKKNIVEDKYNCFAKNIDFSTLSNIAKITNSLQIIYSDVNRKKISIILDKFKPDIVYIHNYNFQLTPSILPEIKKRGKKLFIQYTIAKWSAPITDFIISKEMKFALNVSMVVL